MERPTAPPGVDVDQSRRFLEVATQVFAVAAALLPLTGFLVIVTRLVTMPVVPWAIAASQSLPGLATSGVMPLFVAVGPLVAVKMPTGAPQTRTLTSSLRLTYTTIAIPWVLLTPGFPASVVWVLCMAWLALWFGKRVEEGRPTGLLDLAPRALVAVFIAAVALGCVPSTGQPVYVTSSQPNVVPTGWYVKLTDSTDPMYLLTCTGSKVVAVPESSLVSWTYGNPNGSESLLDILQGGRMPPLGLTPSCPSSQPPNP